MPKNSRICCDQFKHAIYRAIGTTINVSVEGNQLRACQVIEQQSQNTEQEIMKKVAGELNLTTQEVQQHYRNCFSRVMYSDNFDEYRQDAANIIIQLFSNKMPKKEIVAQIKQKYAEKNLFPPMLESFVYETIEKLEKNIDPMVQRPYKRRKQRYNAASNACSELLVDKVMKLFK